MCVCDACNLPFFFVNILKWLTKYNSDMQHIVLFLNYEISPTMFGFCAQNWKWFILWSMTKRLREVIFQNFHCHLIAFQAFLFYHRCSPYGYLPYGLWAHVNTSTVKNNRIIWSKWNRSNANHTKNQLKYCGLHKYSAMHETQLHRNPIN